MKTFSEFIAESEQQSGALAAHLARTAGDRASQSGTVGGTEKKFEKRPSLGLKRPKLSLKGREDKTKDKGPRKPAPYRSGVKPQKALPPSNQKALPSSSSTSIAKRSSQSIRNAGKNTAGSIQKARVRVEPTQRPAIKPTPPRDALPGAKKPIIPMVRAAAKQAALKAAQQRKALPSASS